MPKKSKVAIVITLVFCLTAVLLFSKSKIDFYLKKLDRENIAAMVGNLDEEIIQNKEQKSATLPEKYKNLSDGGEILISYPNTFFYESTGILDNFSGFVYMWTDKQPELTLFNCDQYGKVKKIEKHWYKISC